MACKREHCRCQDQAKLIQLEIQHGIKQGADAPEMPRAFDEYVASVDPGLAARAWPEKHGQAITDRRFMEPIDTNLPDIQETVAGQITRESFRDALKAATCQDSTCHS